ncbi:MAG: hypothetical protein J2P30_01520 [Actinobacteria bacterium]|nr:hypothetical protein [Actinomycetota bacterium]
MPEANRQRPEPPVSIKLHGWVRRWYAARAAETGTTRHALMRRVLTDYATDQSKGKAA